MQKVLLKKLLQFLTHQFTIFNSYFDIIDLYESKLLIFIREKKLEVTFWEKWLLHFQGM